MHVLVTGGTGFVGRHVIHQLKLCGHTVRVLVRPQQASTGSLPPEVETVSGDITQPATLEPAVAGCQGVIHLVGIIREFPSRGITFNRLHTQATQNIIQAMHNQGVPRLLHMSANGARENATTAYHQTKWQAEQAVRQSSLNWTIFRPSLIYGAGSPFLDMLLKQVRLLPIVPVIGDGSYRMSPVYVEDVARGFAKALDRSQTIEGTYHCCGPQELTYLDILEAIGKALGKKRVRTLKQPLPLMRPLTAILEPIPWFPLTSCQLQMLVEGNCCDPHPWSQACDVQPQSFAQGLTNSLGGQTSTSQRDALPD